MRTIIKRVNNRAIVKHCSDSEDYIQTIYFKIYEDSIALIAQKHYNMFLQQDFGIRKHNIVFGSESIKVLNELLNRKSKKYQKDINQ